MHWVDRYFASVAKPDRPIPRVTVTEPERTIATHYKVYEQNTPLPAVMVSYPLPADNDPDGPAISVLNAVLSQGESSRLYGNSLLSRPARPKCRDFPRHQARADDLARLCDHGRRQDR